MDDIKLMADGFLFFRNKATGEKTWQYLKIYDNIKQCSFSLFAHQWIKEIDCFGHKKYENLKNNVTSEYQQLRLLI